MPDEVRTIPFLSVEGEARIFVHVNEVYQFTVPCATRAGHTHFAGATLRVLAEYKLPAWGEMGPRGVNWVCETVHGISTWTTLEQCIDRGFLRKVGEQVLPLPENLRGPGFVLSDPVYRAPKSAWERLLDD